MIFRFLLAIISLLPGLETSAQIKEGIISMAGKEGLLIDHQIEPGETIFTIARLYHVPPAMLSDVNGFDFQAGFQDRKQLFVPVGSYNQLKVKPEDQVDSRPLLYQVGKDDDLFRIGWRTGISPNKLQEWNSLRDSRVKPGTYLHIGWILYDASQLHTSPRQVPSNTVQVNIPAVETNKSEPALLENSAESLYMKQIQDGHNLITERGTAVFFTMPVKTANDFYYGFHHAAPKGALIRVTNPGTGQVVYVKILGPLPNIKQYHNALIGISDRARKKLGVRDEKAWCELSYTGY